MKITFTKFPPGQNLTFEYQFFITPLGKLLIVSWKQALVAVAFAENTKKALAEIKKKYPRSTFLKKETLVQKQVLAYIRNPKKFQKTVEAAVGGTLLQKLVWKALVGIAFGKTVTYFDVAKKIGKAKAVRAVASAVGKNPLAIIIPCHRVVPKSGGVGQYHWGSKNKKNLLAWEQKSK